MAQRHSQQRREQEKVDATPDSARPIVFASPRAIVRGPDGTTTWMARCPRCSDRSGDNSEDNIVAGNEGSARAKCQGCGAIVELRESGIFRVTPTIPPPTE